MELIHNDIGVICIFSDFRAFMKIKGIPIEPKRESGKENSI